MGALQVVLRRSDDFLGPVEGEFLPAIKFNFHNLLLSRPLLSSANLYFI